MRVQPTVRPTTLCLLTFALLAAPFARADGDRETRVRNDRKDITAGGQWIHDQGSLDILRVSDPDQLRATWGTTRTQMVDFEGRVAGLAAGVDDAALVASLGQVGQSAAGLRGALDSSVSLRLDPDAAAKTELVESATQTVLQRRVELQSALARLTPMSG